MESEIFKSVQDLINGTRDSNIQKSLVNFRISFEHKINSIIFHLKIIETIEKKTAEFIEEEHKNSRVVFGDENMRRNIAIAHELEFKYTSLMEDVIYHTLSAIDNLSLVLGIYYKGVLPTHRFNSARNALNQNHNKNLAITTFINKSWDDWLDALHEFRGNIYHLHSKICTATMVTRLTRTNSGDMAFTEQFMINIPKKMREALNYPNDKDVRIQEFCSDIKSKSFEFFEKILEIIKEDNKITPNS